MTNLTNGELYTMLLDRIRKDRKGNISPEEFESFLKWRNLDYFTKKLAEEGKSQAADTSLVPFLVVQDSAPMYTQNGEYYVVIYHAILQSFSNEVAKFANLWWSSSDTNYGSKIEVDLLTNAELSKRLNNAITKPTNSNPIAWRGGTITIAGPQTFDTLWVKGDTSAIASGYIVADYYKYPAEPYFDYYTDASGNITYLTDGQSAYTLLTGEIARDGKVAGQAVTSLSQDLEWDDEDALEILDMIVSDVSIALSDPSSFQASLIERKENT